MGGARYVVLGLAPSRAPWFRDVAQWANAGALPAEFVKCLSAEEVRARLGSGRPFSAVLVDASLATLDRDLIDRADAAGCAVITVGGARDWTAIGATAALPATFDRKDLAGALAAHAPMIGRADRTPDPSGTGGGWQAPLVAVTGPGGTGASTAAMALAQGFGADSLGGSVLLADLCRHADQGMLHDARDVGPGIQEVVDAFRTGSPGDDDLRAMTFEVPGRGYNLVLGLRRSRAWSTIRPRAFEAALAGLRRLHRIVVADVDPDLEGEDDGGSADVEDRHVMSRTACALADAVFVVGLPGLKGIHALTRAVGEIVDFGVPAPRVVTVVNRAPRAPRARAELTRAVAQLLPSFPGASPIFVPERNVDEAIRDGVRLPDAVVGPLAGAYRAVSRRAGAGRPANAPALVTPGTLGWWPSDLAFQP